jgi:hypothetical protein
MKKMRVVNTALGCHLLALVVIMTHLIEADAPEDISLVVMSQAGLVSMLQITFFFVTK